MSALLPVNAGFSLRLTLNKFVLRTDGKLKDSLGQEDQSDNYIRWYGKRHLQFPTQVSPTDDAVISYARVLVFHPRPLSPVYNELK